jgi:tRNA(adenine34) deaminase
MLALTNDEYYMKRALDLAITAFEEDEIPIGAIVVCKEKIIGKGYNQTEKLNDPTAHAEMIALTSAVNTLGTRYLNECTLYVTVEPCPMCAGATYWANLGRIVYGTPDPKRGYSSISHLILHPRTNITKGILEDDCRALMVEFFKEKR